MERERIMKKKCTMSQEEPVGEGKGIRWFFFHVLTSQPPIPSDRSDAGHRHPCVLPGV